MLRLGSLAGVLGLSAPLAACSAEQRSALLAVDPREVRLDTGDPPVPPRPRPSERERRRRAELAGSLAAVGACAGPDVRPPAGRTGGAAPLDGAVQVHRVHADLFRAGTVPGGRTSLLPVPEVDDGGPVLPPGQRPGAVLRAGAAAGLAACLAERAAEDADPALARLHARVAAARAAQASAQRPTDPPVEPVWPTRRTTDAVVVALQSLLAQEHRARWSFAVVLAWSTDRADDAEAARLDHTGRTRALEDLLRRLGADPVGALATYPTDDDGTPVDGPVTAAALALRCADAVTVAAAAVQDATVDAEPTSDRAGAAWVEAATLVLAEAERSRWSWGGAPAVLPGS